MITNKGYISTVQFCKEFNYHKNPIYVMLSKGHPLIHKKGKQVYVDVNGLMKRKEFRKKIWLEAHENFWEFVEYFGSENKLAVWLAKYSDYSVGSWVDFLARHLFMMAPDDLFGYKVPKRLWVFYRLTRLVLRYRDRRVKRIYKRLPNRDRYNELYKQGRKYSYEA